MKVTLDGTPINVGVEVRNAEPGFLRRNLHFIVMLVFAMICAVIGANYWTLLALVSLECAAWSEHQRREHRTPFFLEWGRMIYVNGMAGTTAGIPLAAQALTGESAFTNEGLFALLLCALQCLGGYLLVDVTWHSWAHASTSERARRILPFAWVMFIGVGISLGVSVWIRCWS